MHQRKPQDARSDSEKMTKARADDVIVKVVRQADAGDLQPGRSDLFEGAGGELLEQRQTLPAVLGRLAYPTLSLQSHRDRVRQLASLPFVVS